MSFCLLSLSPRVITFNQYLSSFLLFFAPFIYVPQFIRVGLFVQRLPLNSPFNHKKSIHIIIAPSCTLPLRKPGQEIAGRQDGTISSIQCHHSCPCYRYVKLRCDVTVAAGCEPGAVARAGVCVGCCAAAVCLLLYWHLMSTNKAKQKKNGKNETWSF